MALEDRKLVQRFQQRRKEDRDLRALISNIASASLPSGREPGDIHLLLRFQGDMDDTADSGATAHSGTAAHAGADDAGPDASATHRVMQASDRLQCERVVQLSVV